MRNSSRKAKLPTFNHHDMRHYFCSNAIEADIDFKVIAGWLGHKDGPSTLTPCHTCNLQIQCTSKPPKAGWNRATPRRAGFF